MRWVPGLGHAEQYCRGFESTILIVTIKKTEGGYLQKFSIQKAKKNGTYFERKKKEKWPLSSV
jgi:hypothetical protein